MILTMEQMKHLETDGDDTYKFIDDGNTSKEERQKLIELDESYFDLYGKHMIENYKDL